MAAAAAAADNNGLCVPSTSPKQQPSAAGSSDSNEWQDIRDLLGMSSITAGSKPSGSSDPGSPCSTATTTPAAAAGSGVRNKKSSADTSPSANSGRLSKLFVNSPGGVGSGSFRISNNNNNQLQPPDCPVQIQVHLSNNDIHQQPATRLRRHSLERFVFSIIAKSCRGILRFD